MAKDYAGLLADKLESKGEKKQATMIRERLLKAPKALIEAQKADRGISISAPPIDGDSRLHTVDISHPILEMTDLYLPSAIENRVNEFLLNIQHYDEFLKVEAAQPNRLLVYGEPGTGKTQMARWVAAKLKATLLTVRCDTLISSLLGQTSKNLRQVFEYAQQFPSVLFLDEFDALAGARGNERDIGELQRVVISLLQNIDSLPNDTILIAATNHDKLLDPAIWRRFQFRVNMPLPDIKLREELWKKFLGVMVSKEFNFHDLAYNSDNMSGATIEQVSIDAKRDAIIDRSQFINESKLYRRLYLAKALTLGESLSTNEDEIFYLRSMDKKRFSLRNLSSLYSISTRAITNILKQDGIDEQRKSKG
ncbi:AAA family ATPase [Providencia sp. wls1916]|nr:ATP-binding protein [Providencia sp. wls1916]MTC77726.1 AAA family ATPase [Providencia sp. wls1916]